MGISSGGGPTRPEAGRNGGMILRTAGLLSLVCGALHAECSDAGFCRLPAAAPRELPATWRLGVAATTAKGEASEGLTHDAVDLSLGWTPIPAARVTVSVPWVRNHGRLGRTSGLGDVQAGGELDALVTAQGTWSLQTGIRLPTGDDAALSGAGLGYQPGLGSTDLIFGTGWRLAGWQARVGYVASLGGNDTPGYELERGDDLAAAVAYQQGWRAVTGRLGVVALHRLANSTVAAADGSRSEVADSAGSQVNLQGGVVWQVDPAVALALDGAKAVLSRPAAAGVDGLTRSWSVGGSLVLSW